MNMNNIERKTYSVVRIDNILSRHYGHLYSVKGEAGEDLENGMIGVLGMPLENEDWQGNKTPERELKEFLPIKDNKSPIIMVANDEINYAQYSRVDNSKEHFYIPYGTPAKGYDLVRGDIWSASKVTAITGGLGKPCKAGNFVIPEAGSRFLKEVDTMPTEGAFIGVIDEVTTLGTSTVVDGGQIISRPILMNTIRVLRNDY